MKKITRSLLEKDRYLIDTSRKNRFSWEFSVINFTTHTTPEALSSAAQIAELRSITAADYLYGAMRMSPFSLPWNLSRRNGTIRQFKVDAYIYSKQKWLSKLCPLKLASSSSFSDKV